MNLKEYFDANYGVCSRLAREMGVSHAFLSQAAKGKKAIPAKRAVQIERLTKGAVTRKELRPDDWRDFWPNKKPSKKTKQGS